MRGEIREIWVVGLLLVVEVLKKDLIRELCACGILSEALDSSPLVMVARMSFVI